ncbi:MAG TPA: hypothetical protein EYG03_13560 [Planctomycetes bacterium]|nr:hypothetical protein [Fuerstiella sp.]HIK92989.1 hypothetical protein [Planctomycetota bacterium]
MDLPTCPSCGQSVLDDDAQDCPFCGSAMDGSSKKVGQPKAAKPKAKAAKPQATADRKEKPRAKPDAASSDDPFAVAQSPTAQKAIQCARKPVKGRLHRVVCPMCDTQGFIPKSAIGKQVKCANKECMVPVFTAPRSDSEVETRAPARISDEAIATEKKLTKPPSAKNPVVMYGIVIVVLLVATFGLVFLLNRPSGDEAQLNQPYDMSKFDSDGNDDVEEFVDDKPAEKDATAQQGIDHRGKAIELVNTMIRTARENGHRDKAFCRRLTGDAWLRLGMPDEAKKEFEQMKFVASQSRRDDTAYYRIEPVTAEYWKKRIAGDDAAANKLLGDAKSLAGGIPKSGGLALESAIALAAVLVDSDDVVGATTLITSLQRDRSVASQIDAVRHAAWVSTASSLSDAGRLPLPPLEVFSWNEPMITAVGLHLAVLGQWDSAVQWSTSLQGLTAGDTFAVVAGQMVAANADVAAKESLVTAAAANGTEVAMRTRAVLSQGDAADTFWTKASEAASAFSDAATMPMPGFEGVIAAKTPNLSALRLQAEGIADFATACVKRGDDAAAVKSIQTMYQLMTSVLPPTADIRRASTEIEKSERQVQKQIAEALSLSDQEQEEKIQFFAYRSGVDRFSRAAEERRLRLITMLARVVEHGGATIVQQAMAADDGLRQEIGLDRLSGLLFVAAACSGQDLPEALTVDTSLAVLISGRSDAVAEFAAVDSLVTAAQIYQTDGTAKGVTALENGSSVPGLRAATAVYLVARVAEKTDMPDVLLTTVSELKDPAWRESCFETVTRKMTRRGMLSQVLTAINETIPSPTQRLVAMYGVVRGSIDVLEAAQ